MVTQVLNNIYWSSSIKICRHKPSELMCDLKFSFRKSDILMKIWWFSYIRRAAPYSYFCVPTAGLRAQRAPNFCTVTNICDRTLSDHKYSESQIFVTGHCPITNMYKRKYLWPCIVRSQIYTITNNKQQTTNNKQQTTNNKQQTTNNKQQTTNNKQQTTNNKQQTTNNKQ